MLDFELDFDKCDVDYDKLTQKRRLRLELHEHKSLLMSQDQNVDIECHADASIPSTARISTLPNSEENATDSMENLLDLQQPLIDFNVHLTSGNSTTKLAEYAKPYNLSVFIDGPIDRRFRIHSCYAKTDGHNVEVTCDIAEQTTSGLVDIVKWLLSRQKSH